MKPANPNFHFCVGVFYNNCRCLEPSDVDVRPCLLSIWLLEFSTPTFLKVTVILLIPPNFSFPNFTWTITF